MYTVFIISKLDNISYELGLRDYNHDPEDLAKHIQEADKEFPTPNTEYTVALVEENDVQTNPSLR